MSILAFHSVRGGQGTVRLSNGTELAYSDSGAPTGLTDYDTLIMVHGCGFNKEIFQPMFRARDTCKVRIISYNQRGYAGSTPLTEEERLLKGDRVEMTREYVEDLVLFIQQWQLPRRPIVVGWSKAGYLLLGIAHPTFIRQDLRDIVKGSISGLVFYEPPGSLMSDELTPEFIAADMNNKEKGIQNFYDWAMGFYKPGDTKFYDNSKLLLTRSHQSASKTPSMVRHGFYWANALKPRVQREFAQQAFKTKDIPLVVVHNGESPGYVLQAAKSAKAFGAPTALLYAGGNHFAFAHEPERWIISVLHAFSKVSKTPAAKL